MGVARTCLALVMVLQVGASLGCRGDSESHTPGQGQGGLLLALAAFDAGPETLRPRAARLDLLVHEGGRWRHETFEDADSNVFHKAMACDLGGGLRGILTAGGSAAALKLWRPGWKPLPVWRADFGGSFSRMRDVELADLDGDGTRELVVATHDQGVVAVVRRTGPETFTSEELDREANTFVHEVEVGDLDGDGVPEVYAARSLPNRMDGTPQPGSVVRYVPARRQGRRVVADLGARHAKEVLVDDLDGDRRDELYVSVEAVSGGRVEILRFDAGTAPDAGIRIATIADAMCRCLTAGDVDGDGEKELIVAAHRSGLWLLRPAAGAVAGWTQVAIDARSSGIEHAAVVADLDGDGTGELYVANDVGHEVNRYTWSGGSPVKETILRQPPELQYLTWNLMPVPVDLLP